MAVVAQKALRPLFFISGERGTAKTIRLSGRLVGAMHKSLKV